MGGNVQRFNDTTNNTAYNVPFRRLKRPEFSVGGDVCDFEGRAL